MHEIEADGKKYNGFNLIVGNPEELWYYSNYRNGVTKLASRILWDKQSSS